MTDRGTNTEEQAFAGRPGTQRQRSERRAGDAATPAPASGQHPARTVESQARRVRRSTPPLSSRRAAHPSPRTLRRRAHPRRREGTAAAQAQAPGAAIRRLHACAAAHCTGCGCRCVRRTRMSSCKLAAHTAPACPLCRAHVLCAPRFRRRQHSVRAPHVKSRPSARSCRVGRGGKA